MGYVIAAVVFFVLFFALGCLAKSFVGTDKGKKAGWLKVVRSGLLFGLVGGSISFVVWGLGVIFTAYSFIGGSVFYVVVGGLMYGLFGDI
ncbi:hypothetical protein HQ571_02635 [Candidatus Kuenenbacteria bacterium]|nr:hypothetical protein [Candidatus Kuenenbacteria bacterium]